MSLKTAEECLSELGKVRKIIAIKTTELRKTIKEMALKV